MGMESGFSNMEEAKESEKRVMYLGKEYDLKNSFYTNDGYTFQSNQYLKKMAAEQHACRVACKYPLFKMLRAITKKFFFNELEIVFFAYILDQNKWQYDEENVRRAA
jgi:hypothetical protein